MIVELAAAANHQQIGPAVAIGIEKDALHILLVFITADQILPRKAPIPVLQIDPARLLESAADKNILEPIPIQIARAQKRALLRIFLQDRWLELVIEKESLLMLKID